MLARLHRCHRNLEVRVGHREVDDDVDLRRLPAALSPHRLDAVFRGLALRPAGHVEIGAGRDLHAAEQRRQFEVGRGDVAAADDADAAVSCSCSFPSNFFAAAMERVAKRSSSLGLSCSMIQCMQRVPASAAMWPSSSPCHGRHLPSHLHPACRPCARCPSHARR